MALDASTIAAIVDNMQMTQLQGDQGIKYLLEQIAANVTGASDMPATPGDVEANKIAQLGANKELDEVHAEALYLGAAAGTLVTTSAAELNVMAAAGVDATEFGILNGATLTTAELNVLAGISAGLTSTELDLLDGLTKSTAQLNALTSNEGRAAVGVVRFDGVCKDEETITIGADVYEFDTHVASTITGGRIRLDISGGTTVKAACQLTLDTQPTAGDDMTIAGVVYTFVPDGTANAAGEIDVGSDLADCKLGVVNALEGDDGWNAVPTLFTCETVFTVNDLVITLMEGGTDGNSIGCTETFTAGGNIFDAGTFGTEVAGVDATAGESSDAFVAAVNASGTEDISAIDIAADEVLLVADAVGVVTTAIAETMATVDNTVDSAAMRGGGAAAGIQMAKDARVPNAQEVLLGNMHFSFDFVPNNVQVQVRVTADGTLTAWNGAMTITAGGSGAVVELDNSGGTDWAATSTVYILAML